MNKFTIFTSALLMASSSAFAGGLLTNTNQHASFLRNPSRDAVIDIDAVYSNPAGVAFMSPGFHYSVTWQNAKQSRNIQTTFAPLATNANYLGQSTREYKGKASAPVIPSGQFAFVKDNWCVNAAVAISGGGGKCEFSDGLGLFEVPYSLIQAGFNQQLAAAGMGQYAAKGYSMDMYMRGRQYYIGTQIGGAYKINDKLSVGGGIRLVWANCNYTGSVNNINLYYDPVNKVDYTGTPLQDKVNTLCSSYEIDLNTDQTGLGVTPYISVDYKPNKHWNLAAKYEFKTRMRLKNSTSVAKIPTAAQATLGAYVEDITPKIKEDIPGTFTCGVQYSPIEKVRINAGFHLYDDTHASKHGDKQKEIDGPTTEITAGAEWDIIPLLTVSAGFQRTMYNLSDTYMNDLSFNNSSNLFGCGVRVNITEKLSLDLGYMVNFYEDKTVETPNCLNTGYDKTDVYSRTNRVFAASVNFSF